MAVPSFLRKDGRFTQTLGRTQDRRRAPVSGFRSGRAAEMILTPAHRERKTDGTVHVQSGSFVVVGEG
jgi:hypothetical protein